MLGCPCEKAWPLEVARSRRRRGMHQYADTRPCSLRERLILRAQTETTRLSDVVAFLTWCVTAVAWHVAGIAAGLGAVRTVWLSLR